MPGPRRGLSAGSRLWGGCLSLPRLRLLIICQVHAWGLRVALGQRA